MKLDERQWHNFQWGEYCEWLVCFYFSCVKEYDRDMQRQRPGWRYIKTRYINSNRYVYLSLQNDKNSNFDQQQYKLFIWSDSLEALQRLSPILFSKFYSFKNRLVEDKTNFE